MVSNIYSIQPQSSCNVIFHSYNKLLNKVENLNPYIFVLNAINISIVRKIVNDYRQNKLPSLNIKYFTWYYFIEVQKFQINCCTCWWKEAHIQNGTDTSSFKKPTCVSVITYYVLQHVTFLYCFRKHHISVNVRVISLDLDDRSLNLCVYSTKKINLHFILAGK